MKKAAQAVAMLMAACIAMGAADAAKKKAPAAPACVTGADETALQMRTVQTELMVAALSCSATANYNAFVTGNQKTLMAAHGQLQKFFKSHGGEKALNAFITRLANESSRRSISNIALFCQQTGYLYVAILSPDRIDLATFISPLWVAQLHGYPSCTPRATYIVYGPDGPMEVAPPYPVSQAATPGSAPAPAAGQADTGAVPTPKPKPANIASH